MFLPMPKEYHGNAQFLISQVFYKTIHRKPFEGHHDFDVHKCQLNKDEPNDQILKQPVQF